MSFAEKKCPICNSNDLEEITIGSSIIIFCNYCNIHFSSDIPKTSSIENYYKNTYKITDSDFIKTEKRRISRIPEQFLLLGEITQYTSSAATILDIGCDKGFFLDEARRLGFEVIGVEPSESARNYCKNIGLNVFQDIQQVEGTYKIITMWHSLEHVPNPVEYLSIIKSKLQPDGLLLIRVPAFDSRWSKFLGSKWIWFQPHNHYFHYSNKSLRYLLQSQNFEVIKIETKKPNTRLTRKAFFLSQFIFSQSFQESPTLKDILKYFYQSLTGVELFAIARIK